MSSFSNGVYRKRYLDPRLRKEISVLWENFRSLFPAVPQAAISSEGVFINRILNNVDVTIVDSNVNIGDRRSVKTPSHKKSFVPWHTMSTDTLAITEEDMKSMAYDIKDATRSMLVSALYDKMQQCLIYNLQPARHTEKTPIIEVATKGKNTGDRGTLKRSDILTLIKAITNKDFKAAKEKVLLLSHTHYIDLCSQEDAATTMSNLMVDLTTGRAKKQLMGMELAILPFDMYRKADGTRVDVGSVLPNDACVESLIVAKKNVLTHFKDVSTQYLAASDNVVHIIPQSNFSSSARFIGERLDDDNYVASVYTGIKA